MADRRAILRRLGRDLWHGLAALGQSFGALLPPECHGRPIERAADEPATGHPERMSPVAALPPGEREQWRRWERELTERAATRRRINRPR
jgi:hypothetical protein